MYINPHDTVRHGEPDALPLRLGSLQRSVLVLAASLAAEAFLVAAVTALLGAFLPVSLFSVPPVAAAVAYAAVAVMAQIFAGPPFPDRAGRGGAGQAVLAVAAVGFLSGVSWYLAPPAALAWAILCLPAVLAIRSGIARLAERTPGLRPVPRRVAMIGNTPSAARMLRQLQAKPQRHTVIIGFFDDRSRGGPLDGVLPCLGRVDDVTAFLHDHVLDGVYMALPWSAGERISELIVRLRYLPLIVRLIPDSAPPAICAAEIDQLEGVVMPTLMLPPCSAAKALLKRTFDILVAALLMALLSPIFLIVAFTIKLDSPGPVFFRQMRTGQFGKPFAIFKFRSLHVAGADSGAETLVTRGDNRVTRVGRFVRKYSIDELPQILNVLFGNMSLVGPRPHAPRAKADGRIYAEVMPDYMMRYRVKPGMTGWAQVNGWRGNTDTEDKLRKRVEYDFHYIEHWSFAQDLLILLRTFASVVSPPPENA